MSDNIGCNVCIEKDIDRVNIMATGKFSEEDAVNYKLSPKHKKEKFWIDLKMNLVHVGVNVEAIPNLEILDSIQIAKLIYFDRWSQDRLTNSMLKVSDSLELVQLIYRNFSEMMSQQNSKA